MTTEPVEPVVTDVSAAQRYTLAFLARADDEMWAGFKQADEFVLASDYDALTAQVKQMREALDQLQEYAEHADHCGDASTYNNETHRCGCGLDSLNEWITTISQGKGRG